MKLGKERRKGKKKEVRRQEGSKKARGKETKGKTEGTEIRKVKEINYEGKYILRKENEWKTMEMKKTKKEEMAVRK